MPRNRFSLVLAILPVVASLSCARAGTDADPLTAAYPEDECSSCAGWNEPQAPFHIHGDSYYVGTRGLAAILITSEDGHVLIDGGLPDSAPLIIQNIGALGFDVADIELLVNSHAHFDHSGGLAALQRASGARVAASGPSADVLESGRAGPDDPQYGVLFDYPPIAEVERFDDGDTLRVGQIELIARLTPGHTPGGTTWTWRSCEGGECLDFVYADSLTPISADDFLFSGNDRYPDVLADFERAYTALETMRCDVLITPHPAASGFWDRVEGADGRLVDPDACRRYASNGRRMLEQRLSDEAAR